MKHPLLESALAAHQSGNLKYSEECFEKYLALAADDAQAWYLLGMVNFGLAKYQNAVAKINSAISLNPNSAQYYCSLGLCNDRLGELVDAEKAYQQAEKMRPDVFQVHYDYGCFLQNQKRYLEAANYFKKSIALNPNHYPSYSNLASVLHLKGDLKEAEEIARKINLLVPDNPQLMNNLAQILIEQVDYKEAHELLQRAVQIDANFITAQITMAQLNYFLDNKSTAEEMFKQILIQQPEDYKVKSLLANCLIDREEFQLAEQLLHESLQINPNYLGSHLHLGNCYNTQGKFENAIVSYLKGLECQSDSVECFYALGIAYSQQGDFENSRINFIQALQIDKHYLKALHALTKTTKYTDIANEEIKIAQDLATDIETNKLSLKDENAIDLYFSLGKIYADLKDYDVAFEYYQRANGIRYASHSYDIELIKNYNRSCFATFDSTHTEIEVVQQENHLQPIFIVGMARSGTTLLEQILASHSQIDGAGELNEIQLIAKSLDNYPENLYTASKPLLKTKSVQYQTKLQELGISNEMLWVIDKNPINFMHVGLIKSILPQAKIIHMQRHPLDIILSVYFQRLSKGHAYAFDLPILIQYYKQYHQLMTFWQKLYGDQIINCRYDSLIDNTQPTISKILEKLDLEWQQNCENFHQNNRKITTASSWQVRQPLYHGSINRWQKYQKHLLKAQGELADEIMLWEQGVE